MSFEPRMSAPLTEKKPLLSTAGRNRCRSAPEPFFGSMRCADWAEAGASPAASADAAAATAMAPRKRRRAKGTDLSDCVIGLLALSGFSPRWRDDLLCHRAVYPNAGPGRTPRNALPFGDEMVDAG